MDRIVDKALGVHPQALSVGAKRLELLAGNMANADTPGFKARDIDFRAALQAASQQHNGRLQVSHARHLPLHNGALAMHTQYRIPNHPALDGNTVDSQLEQAAFSEAAVRYQASLDFLSSRIDGLRKALRGD